jgi:hypothetical protein
MIRQMSTGKGKWAQLARQFGGGMPGMSGAPGMPALPEMDGMPKMPALPKHGIGGKKTGKAARKEKRKHKAKSGRR